jgi:hypothetical protein
MNEEDEENLQKKQEQEQERAQTPSHLPLISKNDLNPIPDLNEILLVSGGDTTDVMSNDAKEMKLMVDLLRDEDEEQPEMVVVEDHDDETPQPQSPLPRVEVIDSSSQLLSDNDHGAKVDEVKVEMVTGEPKAAAAAAQTVPSPPKKGMDIVVTRLNSFFLLCIVPLLIIFCKIKTIPRIIYPLLIVNFKTYFCL